MSKVKSIFVTAVMAVMLAVILAGAAVIEPKAYAILAAVLTVYGFLCGCRDVCGWLQKDPPEPKHLSQETVEADPFEQDDEREDYHPLFGISGDKQHATGAD